MPATIAPMRASAYWHRGRMVLLPALH